MPFNCNQPPTVFRKPLRRITNFTSEKAPAPSTVWLISVAKTDTNPTYQAAKQRLEQEHGFQNILTPQMGFVAGTVMEVRGRWPDRNELDAGPRAIQAKHRE